MHKEMAKRRESPRNRRQIMSGFSQPGSSANPMLMNSDAPPKFSQTLNFTTNSLQDKLN